jgi:UDPglucose 6-dehydrogenase
VRGGTGCVSRRIAYAGVIQECLYRRWAPKARAPVREGVLSIVRGEKAVTERICVCGMGKVGRPILGMLRRKGFKAVGYDRDKNISETLDVDSAVLVTTATIFIVQTPSLADGSFSNEYLLSALTEFASSAKRHRPQMERDYLYIVTSTTVPGSCDEFRKIVGDNIVYKPEFIRLEYVDIDLLTPNFILMGEANSQVGDRAESLFRAINLYDKIPVYRMSLLEAELAKITLNCALTMKISLANQLHLVAKKMGADSKKIMEAVGADPRINPCYLEPGRPYSGPCLPRDNRMFRYTAEKVGVDAALSEAADRINERIF